MRPLDDRTMAGYTLLVDLYDTPNTLVEARMPRDVKATGDASLRLLVGSLVLISVAFSGLLLVILSRLVLSPLACLSAEVTRVGVSGNLSERLAVRGADELARFGSAINGMLQALQDAQAREKALLRQVQELRIQIDEVRRKREVTKITESSYFQDLRERSAQLRARHNPIG